MAFDLHPAMLDDDVLETVARMAVAGLRPTTSAKDHDEARRSGELRADVAADAGEDAIAFEVKSAAGAARVSEHDLSQAIAVALRTIMAGEDVMVLRGEGFRTDAVVRRLVERLPSMVEARRRTLTQEHIEALVEAYLPADTLASVMPDIEADNASAQADFLKTHPVLTAEEVADRAGHGATNRSATATRWKGEQRIFAVRAPGGGRSIPRSSSRTGGQGPPCAPRSRRSACGADGRRPSGSSPPTVGSADPRRWSGWKTARRWRRPRPARARPGLARWTPLLFPTGFRSSTRSRWRPERR